MTIHDYLARAQESGTTITVHLFSGWEHGIIDYLSDDIVIIRVGGTQGREYSEVAVKIEEIEKIQSGYGNEGRKSDT